MLLEGGVLIVVYFDLLFLLNFGMNYWLLWATAILARRRVRPWQLCGSAALGAVAAFTWVLVPLTFTRELILKGVVAALMVALCFRPVTVSTLLKQTATLVALSAFSAGVTYAAALSHTSSGLSPPSVGWYLVAGGPLLLSLPLRRMWSYLAACVRVIEAAGRFRFRVDGTTVELDAVLDTGNTLVEPFTCRPVVVVDTSLVAEHLPPRLREAIERWQEGDGEQISRLPDGVIGRVTLIPYTTVAASGLMLAIRPEVCEVESRGGWHAIEAVVAFAVGEVRLTGKGALLPRALWPLS